MKKATLLGAVVSLAIAATLVPAAASVAAGTLPTLTLTLTKNTVTVGGSPVSGAVDVVSTVKGEASDDPGLVLLRPGVTISQFGQAVSKLGPETPLDAIDPYGTIVFDGSATAGTPSSAQVDLQPGTYVALENGNGHAVFTVTKAAQPAALPAPAATEKAIDFGFRGPATLHDGELVRFENDGYLIHMFQYAPARNGADAKKAAALLIADKPNAAKKLAIGPLGQFAGPISTGAYQQQVVTQPPGVYVMFCSMNTEDGREHYALGMARVIRIVK